MQSVEAGTPCMPFSRPSMHVHTNNNTATQTPLKPAQWHNTAEVAALFSDALDRVFDKRRQKESDKKRRAEAGGGVEGEGEDDGDGEGGNWGGRSMEEKLMQMFEQALDNKYADAEDCGDWYKREGHGVPLEYMRERLANNVANEKLFICGSCGKSSVSAQVQ